MYKNWIKKCLETIWYTIELLTKQFYPQILIDKINKLSANKTQTSDKVKSKRNKIILPYKDRNFLKKILNKKKNSKQKLTQQST